MSGTVRLTVKLDDVEVRAADSTARVVIRDLQVWHIMQLFGLDSWIASTIAHLCRAGHRSPSALVDLRRARTCLNERIRQIEEEEKSHGQHRAGHTEGRPGADPGGRAAG